MEISQLRYLVETVRRGGVGAAARALHVTQPAVSAQLKRLQEEVGEPLFERRGRGLVPTQAGRLLVSHAEAVLRRLDALDDAMQGLQSLESGYLRMGNIDAASVYVLPDLYRDFHRRYPGVRIEIAVGDTRGLLELLAHGDVELATTTLPVERDGFVAHAIYREELVPVAHRSHELVAQRRVSPADLVDAGLITYPPESNTRRLIDDVFASRRVAVRATMEISSPEAMKRLTQAGLGVSILPRPLVQDELDRGELVTLPIGRARFEREIGMVYRDRASLSPAARVFLEMVESRAPAEKGSRSARSVRK